MKTVRTKVKTRDRIHTGRIYEIDSNEVAVTISGKSISAIIAKYEELTSAATRDNYPEIMAGWMLNQDDFAFTFFDFGVYESIHTIDIELGE
jgi:hypothetical protein